MEEHGAIEFGLSTNVHLIFSAVVVVIFVIFAYLATRKKEDVPSGMQNFGEAVVEFLLSRIEPEFGSKLVPIVLPFLGAFFLYILASNWLGLIPFFLPPTSDLSTTAALAAISILGIQIVNVQINRSRAVKQWVNPHPELTAVEKKEPFKGLKGRLGNTFFAFLLLPLKPLESFMRTRVWLIMKHGFKISLLALLLVPLRIIDNVARTLSLSLRLFGNIGGEHIVFEKVSEVVPIIFPVLLLLLGILVGLIQAAVFSLLSMYYLIEEANIHGHEKEH